MKKVLLVVILLMTMHPLALMALDAIEVGESFEKRVIGKDIEYLEDKTGSLLFEQAR